MLSTCISISSSLTAHSRSKNIIVLDLSYNRLPYIPSEIGELQLLRSRDSLAVFCFLTRQGIEGLLQHHRHSSSRVREAEETKEVNFEWESNQSFAARSWSIGNVRRTRPLRELFRRDPEHCCDNGNASSS
jgi:hypothetical protein